MTSRSTKTVSFVWGLLEAALFFVIPDVLLTWVASRYGTRRAIVASLWAVAGAAIGGMITYQWGAHASESAFTYMGWLPGVDTAMIQSVTTGIQADGPQALLGGPLRGEPFKLYAAAAGAQGESIVELVLWTIPGRLWRFVALSGLFGLIREGCSRLTGRNIDRPLVVFWALFWLMVYAVFWTR